MELGQLTDSSQPKRRLTIETPFLNRAQLRHFVLFDVLPAIASVFAVVWSFHHPIGVLEVGLFAVMWLLTGIGVSVGYHRLFTHRTFKTTRQTRTVLAVLGSMAALGPVISWVAIHRRHHERADEPGDMHSPNLHGGTFLGRLRGLLHAHLTWAIKHEYPNIAHYAPDLLEDPAIVRISRSYKWWVLSGCVLPGAIGGVLTMSWQGALAGWLWGGCVRMFVVAQSISALNSILHTFGSRRFTVRDNSRNNPLIGVLTWGEGWHNNHHAFPTSASFALAWYPVDVSYWLIALLQRLGMAWDVHVPTKAQIDSRAAAGAEPVPPTVCLKK
jgi:stearoyl-CoA desaturase (delta-9 desaturase)